MCICVFLMGPHVCRLSRHNKTKTGDVVVVEVVAKKQMRACGTRRIERFFQKQQRFGMASFQRVFIGGIIVDDDDDDDSRRRRRRIQSQRKSDDDEEEEKTVPTTETQRSVDGDEYESENKV